MRRWLRATAAAIVVVMALSLATRAGAQHQRVGVALSGGGAMGFAHIGVLRVLDEAGIPVDFVAGTSMGAVIGGLYAVGHTPDELAILSVATDWNALFSDREKRQTLSLEHKRTFERYLLSLPLDGWHVRLPSGLIAGQNLMMLFARMTWPYHGVASFSDLPIPFACVATDIVTGEMVVLHDGYLPLAIRASMSIPSVFTPVEWGGRLLVDGGIARRLPAQNVRDLGADIVIGVDVTAETHDRSKLNTLDNIMEQSLALQLGHSDDEQRAMCDVLIKPDVGSARTYDFDRAAFLIAQGEAAARAALPELIALRDSLGLQPRPPAPPIARIESDSIRITGITVDGLRSIPGHVIKADLGLKVPGRYSLDDIEDGVSHIYGYELFDRVEYQLVPAVDGNVLALSVIEKGTNHVRAGFRYDSRTDAEVLVNATFQNLGSNGSALSLDLKLGQEPSLEARYWLHSGFVRSAGLRLRGAVSQVEVDVFDGDARIARFRTRYSFGELLVGNLFSTRMALAAGIRAEDINGNRTIGPVSETDANEQLFPLVALMQLDTRDRRRLPTRGVLLHLSGEHVAADLGTTSRFTRYYLDWRAAIPVTGRWTLSQSLYLGTSSNDNLTPFYQFSLGGINASPTLLGEDLSFLGLKEQERVGPHAQFLQVGVQFEFLKAWYALAQWNIGNAFDRWNTSHHWDDFENGGGLTIAHQSILGLLSLTGATSSRHDFLAHVTLGQDF